MGSKLKLLPDTHRNARKIVNDAKQTGNLLHNNWWYLHGHLSDIVGYDKASIINAKDCTEFVKELPEFMKLSYNGESWEGAVQTINLIPHAYINGVVECEVIGVSEPCVGYFWTTNEEPLRIIAKNGEVVCSFQAPKRKSIKKSKTNARLSREAQYNKTFKEGGCTFGDMDISRHRNVYYDNGFPAGHRCPHCGTFWID